MPRRLDDDGDLVVVAVDEPVEGHRPACATVAPTNKYLAQISKSLLTLSKRCIVSEALVITTIANSVS